MTYIINRVTPALVKTFFKWQDHHHLVYHFPQNLHPVFFPCPNLGGDVIRCFESFSFGEFCHRNIEAGIINEDDEVGLVLQDIAFAKTHVAQNCRQVADHFSKSHECKVPVMFDNGCTFFLHQVSTPGTKVCLVVILLDGPDQPACMQVS